MKRRNVLLLALAAIGFTAPPEPTPPIDRKINFTVSVVGKRHDFHIGEIIPIELSFSSQVKARYQLDEAHYDRSGRMEFEQFRVTPADGAVDPLADYHRGMGGGLTGSRFLKTTPWTIRLNLNEWVRFTKPGEYKARVSSSRVERLDRSRPHGTLPVIAVSNEISLKILPRDPAWETGVYEEAVATLRSSSSVQATESAPRRQALERLRFLGTSCATRELANQLRGQERGVFDAYIGLVTSPEPGVARKALEENLSEPDRPIGDTFLSALIQLRTRDAKGETASREEEGKVLQDIARVLPLKDTEALPVSLYSLLNHFWVRGGKELLPQQMAERLVEQLVLIFDRLTPEQQASLFDYRWEHIKSHAVLPLLQKYSQHDSPELAAAAIRRWFEVDPVGARPAIISEISRPKPRFSARELGMLPDLTLPEVDQALADHLSGAEDFDTTSRVASLVARYAVLDQILRELDPGIGRFPCDVQNPLLAYVLRVDPEAAKARIKKSLAARGEKFTACNQRLFEAVSAIHHDPVLEEIALQTLDDPDPELAGSAAQLLARSGPSAAEGALWQRYERWCKRWAGRELQLNLQATKVHYMTRSRAGDDMSLGVSLVRAIALGQRWLTDEPKLTRLRTMSRVPTIADEIDGFLERWRQAPFTVNIFSCGPATGAQPHVKDPDGFSARVAQYDFDSLDALKEKLSQFPPGTTFRLSPPSEKAKQSCAEDLRAFLTAHEFSVTGSKSEEEH